MRITGDYRILDYSGEVVRAFTPRPLPPMEPPLVLSDELRDLHSSALSAVQRLAVAGVMVPTTCARFATTSMRWLTHAPSLSVPVACRSAYGCSVQPISD